MRRGGRLVVAVGGNAGLVAQLPGLQELLPFTVNATTPSRAIGTLVLYWGARESSQTSTFSGALAVKGSTFQVANLVAKPNRPSRVLIPPPDRQAENKDVIAGQSAYGLGRVTAIGFDLDRAPFTDFTSGRSSGTGCCAKAARPAPVPGARESRGPAVGTLTEEEDEVAVALRTHTDTFEGVPVVSFGWVAFLIVLYILLIGPIEYFFLKRVLGRLELTWITFPIIVLTVSLAAYFTAYSIKGRDLKINKVDVVDVDPASRSRLRHDVVHDLQPADRQLHARRHARRRLVGRRGARGHRRSAGSGATRRTARACCAAATATTPDAEGHRRTALEKVPIQVWSTKSFVANWSSRLNPAARRSFESRPRTPGGRPAVT